MELHCLDHLLYCFPVRAAAAWTPHGDAAAMNPVCSAHVNVAKDLWNHAGLLCYHDPQLPTQKELKLQTCPKLKDTDSFDREFTLTTHIPECDLYVL